MGELEEYILMNKKAKEIQKKWKPKNGDYIQFGNEVRVIVRIDENMWFAFHIGDTNKYSMCTNNAIKDNIWLPRQDDLQGMVLEEGWVYRDSISLIYKFYEWVYGGIPSRDVSMEQIWLSFVMEEKHNKIWSEHDKDWITPKKPFTLNREYFENQDV